MKKLYYFLLLISAILMPVLGFCQGTNVPVISSFTPLSDAPGSIISIRGRNFGNSITNLIVNFGTAYGETIEVSDSLALVRVPNGASYSQLTIYAIDRNTSFTSSLYFNPAFNCPSAFLPSYINPRVNISRSGTSPHNAYIQDIDGDGKPDILTSNDAEGNITVFRNNLANRAPIAAAGFSQSANFNSGNFPWAMAISDLNSDGKPDVVVTNFQGDNISILQNTSTPGVINANSLASPVVFNSGARPQGVVIADFDLDGKPDIAVCNQNSDNVSVYRNVGTGNINNSSFQLVGSITVGDRPTLIVSGDLDLDGKIDLITANYGGNTLSVIRNNSDGSALTPSSFNSAISLGSTGNPYGIVIGDLNNDNKPEIVSVNVSSNGIRIYQNQTVVGSLTTSSFATPFFLPTGTGPVYVGISDIDSDNKPDLVTSNYTSANITVHRNIHATGNLSTSSFAAGSNFSSGAGANSVALSDLNADGKPDFVITNQNSQNTSIFPNGTPSEITTRPSVTPVGSLDLCLTPQVTLEASIADNYLWSTGETTRTITVRNPGVYFVRVRRNGSCISDRSEAGVIRVLGERTLTISANRPTNFCNGDSVILTANELSGYIWNTGETTRSITVRTSGSYSVRRIANNCTSGVSNTIAVNVTQGEANVNVLSGRTLLCFGETTTLEAPIAQGYLWSNGATSRSITVGTSGSYSVRVINGICTSNISTPVEVIVSGQIPLPTITSDRTSICANDSVLLTASVAFRYRWSTGDTTRSIWVRNQGNYAVRHISAQGCSSDLSQPINISLINIPTPTISAVRTQICEGEAASITCSNANALICIWSNGASSSTINPNSSGIYTVRLVSTGCTSEVSNPIEIIVSPLPPQAVITPNRAVNAICEGDSIILTATNSAGYLWSNGANTQNIRVKQAGNYTVKLINAIGCEGPLSEAFNLAINPKPSLVVGLDRPSPSICENDSVTLTAADGLTYLWSTGETTRSIVVKTTQQIGLTVSNGQCTNASSSLVSVSLNPRPNPVTLTLNGDLEICDGDSVRLSATVSSGGYIWNTGETNQSITVRQTGIYSVSATNGGCFSVPSDTLNLRVKVVPKPNIDTNLIVRCIGDSVQLIANQADGQIWNNGDTTRSIFIKEAGFYSYQTKSEGCLSVPSDPIEVRFSDGNNVQIIADSIFEFGDTVKLAVKGALSGQWIKGIGLSDSNSLNPIITSLKPGLYTYEALVFDSLGCLKNVNLTIRVQTPFFIPNYITPNSNNQNATWKLMFLQERPNHSVEIFNRYGTPVYYTEKYENEWNATNLSSGIYYYVIKVFGTNERSFKGWLMVNK